MLLVYAFGIALTITLAIKAANRGGHSPDLGSISPQWIAAYNASRHASAS